jgi:hypothetical protein
VIAAWEKFPEVLRTGRAGFNLAYGQSWFEWLAENPELSTRFNQSMNGVFGMEPACVAAAYDFSAFQSIVDVGGGNGNLLAQILSRYPGPRGLVFDQPHVVAEAPALLAKHGMSGRIATQGGDFFESVPAGHDAYLLSHVIHDWDEGKAIQILKTCRAAIHSASKLLILEWVLPEGDTPYVGKMVDLNMMMLMGGEERTGKQYGRLLDQAGFRMTRVIPTRCECSIVEAVPV